MVADFKEVNDDVCNYVADVKKIMPIEKVYLFGSYAKGLATKQSDVDLCFFFDDNFKIDNIDIVAKLLSMTHKYDAFIEPHVFNTFDLTNDNPFIKEIIRTGRELN